MWEGKQQTPAPHPAGINPGEPWNRDVDSHGDRGRVAQVSSCLPVPAWLWHNVGAGTSLLQGGAPTKQPQEPNPGVGAGIHLLHPKYSHFITFTSWQPPPWCHFCPHLLSGGIQESLGTISKGW